MTILQREQITKYRKKFRILRQPSWSKLRPLFFKQIQKIWLLSVSQRKHIPICSFWCVKITSARRSTTPKPLNAIETITEWFESQKQTKNRTKLMIVRKFERTSHFSINQQCSSWPCNLWFLYDQMYSIHYVDSMKWKQLQTNKIWFDFWQSNSSQTNVVCFETLRFLNTIKF